MKKTCQIKKTTQWVFIFVTFILAWVLMILPVPNGWHRFGPEWLTLVVIYWIFVQPQLVGIATAWCVGLVMDSLYGGVLGQYALSLMTVAFFARFLRYRIRLIPAWQEWLAIFSLLGVGECVLFLVQWMLGRPDKTMYYLVPVLSSVVGWPLIRRLINFYERKVFA
ncbi:MAG TPA: rod shape-determining protein MreD [Gammaproteobacteria bacterium]|nr:rod shape-determining protein MreD [Gammaproteobacteria bacterium]HRA42475.1 rod shape-determining protein MreD [Gammaproteobacteria bacterium]